MFFLRRLVKQDEVRGSLVVLVSFVVVLGSAISLYLSMRPRYARLHAPPYYQMGVSAAQKVAELTGGHAQVVTWRVRFRSAMPMVDASLKMFRREVSKSSGMKIIGSEETAYTASMPMMEMEWGLMDGAQFRALLEKYPQADVLVMFGGPPTLRDDEFATLPPRRPKVVVLAVSAPPQKKLFKEHVVQAAIVPRVQVAPVVSAEALTPAEWFDRNFTFVSAENADQLSW